MASMLLVSSPAHQEGLDPDERLFRQRHNSTGSTGFPYRKKHRRKKSRRSLRSQGEGKGSPSPPPPRTPSPPPPPPSPKKRQVILRPALPKAPENSTQFIMDDHESSSLFWNFETAMQSPPPPEETSNGFWNFLREDFEVEYARVKGEEWLQLPRDLLVEKATELRKRESDLLSELRLHPERLIARLQEDLLELQRENRALEEGEAGKGAGVDTSLDSDSDSSSSGSSSCSTCSSSGSSESSDEGDEEDS